MTDKHVLIAIIVLVIIRYQLDLRLFNALALFAGRLRDHFTADIDDEPIADEHIDWQDTYDARIERMKAEVETFNQSPTNAETAPGVYNIPHESIKLDIDIQPAVEEEHEAGPQEVAL